MANITEINIGNGQTVSKLEDANGRKMICEVYDPKNDYVENECCIYNDTFYKFTNSKSAGEWDDSKVTPTTLAAEIKLLRLNFQEATDELGNAISGLGVEVPSGATITEMANLIATYLIMRTTTSSISASGSSANMGASTHIPTLKQSKNVGTAFMISGTELFINHDTTVNISVSASLSDAHNKGTYMYLQKNRTNVSSTSYYNADIYQVSWGTRSVSYSGDAKKGDKFRIVVVGNGDWSYVNSVSLKANAVNQ